MCVGYLCEMCKSDYGKRKIIWNYEIVFMILNNENLVDFMYCFIYINKKLECYCNFCKELVCIDCIIWFYNGYFVKFLFIIYNELIDYYKNRKKEIENVFFLKYREVFVKEIEKWLVFIMKVDEI